MKNLLSSLIAFLWFSHFLLGSQAIPFSGKLSIDGENFTGEAEFTFSIVTQEGETLWVHDEANEPLNITVENGRYLALLGAQGTTPIPSDLFASEENLSLRVAVDLRDGVGLRVLSPDQEISAVPIALSSLYSAHAGEAGIASSVKPGAITAEMLSEEVLSEFEEINATIADLLSQDYTPEVGSISTSLLSEELQSKILNFELSIEEILDQSNDPAAGSITREMLADSLSSDLSPLIGQVQTSPVEGFTGWIWEDDYMLGDVTVGANGEIFAVNDLDYEGYGITKLNAYGDVQWSSFFYAQDDEWSFENEPYSVTATADGGAIIIGISDAGLVGDKTEDSRGLNDIWVVKTDAQGSLEWDKTLGGSSNDQVVSHTSGVEVNGGGFMILGKSDSGLNGDKSQASFGGTDFWLIKLDGDGNKVWDKAFGGTGSDTPVSLLSLPDGNFLMAGYTTSSASGNLTSTNKGASDVCLIKIDVDGNKIWEKSFGGSGSDALNAICILPDGGFVFAADTTSPLGGDLSSNLINAGNASDLWVVRLDAEGNKMWDQRFGDESQYDDHYASITWHADALHLLHLVSTEYDDVTEYLKLNLEGETLEHKTLDLYLYDPKLMGAEDGFVIYDFWEYEVYKLNSNLDPITGSTDNNPQESWITSSMLSAELQGQIEQLSTSVEQITGTGSTIQDGLITAAMLSSDLQDSLGLNSEDIDEGASGGELAHGRVEYEYVGIGDIASNGDGGYVLLDDDDGDGYNLRNYDAEGTLIFSTYLVAQDYDEWSFYTQSRDAVLASDGGFLIVGDSDAGLIEDKSQAGFGSYDYWIVRVDDQGDVEWDKTFGGTSVDQEVYGAQFSNGNYLVAGKSTSGAGGNKSSGNLGGWDIWAVCINSNGEKVWDQSFGGDRNESVGSVITLTDGNLVIAGTTNSDSGGNISQGSFAGNDVYLLKIDADGNKIWDVTLGGDGDDVLINAIPLEDGGFVFAANSDSSLSGDVGEDEISFDASDAWVVKVNANGEKVWESRINADTNYDEPNPHISTDNDSLHLVYQLSDDTGDTNTYVNLDFSGNILSQKTLMVEWEDITSAIDPIMTPVNEGFIFADLFSYEYAQFNSSLDSLLIFESDLVQLGEKASVELSGGEQAESSIMFDEMGVFLESSPPRYQDFYNHDDYLYLADPDNDPVWSDPQNPDVSLGTSEGRTVERYLAGWAYDGDGADPYGDEASLYAEAPMVDRAFLVPKVTLKGIGPLVLNHMLLDASAKGTAISEEEEYSFTKKYYDWMMEEDVPALWESASLKSSILNVSEELAFTHILDDANNTVGLQLIKALDSGISITEGMVLSSDEIDSVSEVESFSGFPDGATIQLSLDYAIFMGWVSDGGYWIGTRLLMSEIEGSLEEGYVAGGEIYKPVP
jgi:hypothetical protein